jgi:hypothetical protein
VAGAIAAGGAVGCVVVGGANEGLPAFVAVSSATSGRVPIDVALGEAGGVFTAVGVFSEQAAGELLAVLLLLGLGPGLGGGFLGGASRGNRGLLCVSGLLLEE